MNLLSVPTLVLRDTQSFFARIRLHERLGELIGSLAAAATLFLALFGAMIGAFHSPLQLLASAVKLPLLFLATLLITFPTLYVFNILFGARFSMRQYFSLLLGTTAINSVLLLGFAPIGILFMMTTENYLSFKMINILMLAISGLVAMRFFYLGMSAIDSQNLAQPGGAAAVPAKQTGGQGSSSSQQLNEKMAQGLGNEQIEGKDSQTDAPSAMSGTAAERARHYRNISPKRDSAQGRPEKHRRRILKLWVILYALVGSQLAWTLKPFFGDPAADFILFDDAQGGFFIDVLNTLGKMLIPNDSY